MFGGTGPRKTLAEMDNRELIIRSIAITVIGTAITVVGAIQLARSNSHIFQAWCASYILFATVLVVYFDYDHVRELYRRQR